MDEADKRWEPEETHDKFFAPVTRGGDARGRTIPSERDKPGVSGTGVRGVTKPAPDSGTADEAGVRAAEKHDASRRHPRRSP
ncbi:hypothetical protein EDD29_3957 [Actinocorallia herbida]|uniref:Uncharacterized protein n=1 Tax=Actinocorallia herbida TaxID=58109 RepID=A0A3N1CYN8_9ACTN|nr:hypothetical protein [Actinocorallia herbida]ROO86392.1 hypothetical protein EDD29_3957 [Actinocorallia herbida]